MNRKKTPDGWFSAHPFAEGFLWGAAVALAVWLAAVFTGRL